MQQVKVDIDESQIDFIKNYSNYGFKDISSMIRTAIEQLREELEIRQLEKSADLHTELNNDTELK